MSYVNPLPGTYTVTVDGYAVPAGTTTYQYRDAFVSPELGTLTSRHRARAGQRRDRHRHRQVAAKGTVPAGRSLFGDDALRQRRRRPARHRHRHRGAHRRAVAPPSHPEAPAGTTGGGLGLSAAVAALLGLPWAGAQP